MSKEKPWMLCYIRMPLGYAEKVYFTSEQELHAYRKHWLSMVYEWSAYQLDASGWRRVEARYHYDVKCGCTWGEYCYDYRGRR